MADRRFRPGHRNNPQARGTGKMSDERYAWLRTAIGQFVIMRYPTGTPSEDGAEVDNEHGDTIRLYMPRPGRPPVQFNLTALTEEELKLTRQFFNLLFDLADPIVKQRDKVAQDAFAAGDDSFARIYRAIPQLVIRERPQRGHGEGVHNGSEDPSERTGGGSVPTRGVHPVSGELADGEPSQGGSQDDRAATN